MHEQNADPVTREEFDTHREAVYAQFGAVGRRLEVLDPEERQVPESVADRRAEIMLWVGVAIGSLGVLFGLREELAAGFKALAAKAA